MKNFSALSSCFFIVWNCWMDYEVAIKLCAFFVSFQIRKMVDFSFRCVSLVNWDKKILEYGLRLNIMEMFRFYKKIMADLKVFSSEKFERSKTWYVVFACIFISIIALSIVFKNIVWVVLMFFLLWAYIYYGIIDVQEINMRVTENWLIIKNNIVSWMTIEWYCIELDKSSQEIKNIVIVHKKWHAIYTIADSEENLQVFLEQLSNYAPMLQDYKQTFREKFSRKIKL